MKYRGQNVDEKIVLLLRSHPITQLPWIVITIFLLFCPFPVALLLSSFLGPHQILFVVIFMYLLIFTYAFTNTVSWLFNVGIITNQRVIDVDYLNVLEKEETEAANRDISDVTAKNTGYIPSLFDYGDIFIQTEGVAQGIEFLKIAHPSRIVTIISKLTQDLEND
ncbi:MAG: hypothetical protein ACMG6E_01480 [Candidatus Roizmanbacteria bacterium]